MSAKPIILVVDDEETIREVVGRYLEREGYVVREAADGYEALDIIRHDPPALIVLDLMLPGIDGLSLTQHLRQDHQIPIIMLTAKSEDNDRIRGLDLGADDYITKPFDTSVLLARVKAVLRRSQKKQQPATAPEAFSVGDIDIDPRAHTVRLKEKPVELTPIEFRLLSTLAQQAGHVFSADDLLSRVWGVEYVGQPQVVYVHIRALRTKLEKKPNRPHRIITVRGVGYKLIPQKI